jgi:hypothetical protein
VPARLQKVTYSPGKPGPEDPVMVKAVIAGEVLDARVVYTVGDSAELTEPLLFEDGTYRATLPAVLRTTDLKFRVRYVDLLERTKWSDTMTLHVDAPDSDGDSLSDLQERIYGLDPSRPDSDGDGLRDANDPAPLAPFTRAASQIGPTITAAATTPRTPPAGGKKGTLRALVFDPAGVRSVSAQLKADDQALPGGEMKESGATQTYECALPALKAGQTLHAVITATNAEGKSAKLVLSLPVTAGVRITQPWDNSTAKKPANVHLRIEADGEPAYLQVLVNGYPMAKLTQPPYRYDWNPFEYRNGLHEVVVEAYNAEDQLVDYDLIRIKVAGDTAGR